jgi:putative phosphoribosyl transferase
MKTSTLSNSVLSNSVLSKTAFKSPGLNHPAARPIAAAEQLIQIPTRGTLLEGTMVIPAGAHSIAVFVQADGSCRLNPRNHYLSHILRQYGLATLLVDLTTLEEQMVCSRSESLHCDLETMAMRLVEITDWLQQDPNTAPLQIGYLGLYRGSHVAFLAATERPDQVKTIVATGSNLERLELALPYIKAPTLLIVGGLDQAGLACHQKILPLLPPCSDLAIVPRAGSLLHESQNLAFIGQLTSQWFKKLDVPAEPTLN